MAVTIDELQVETQAAPPAASPPAAGAEAGKDVDLSEGLQMLHERKLRLRAD